MEVVSDNAWAEDDEISFDDGAENAPRAFARIERSDGPSFSRSMISERPGKQDNSQIKLEGEVSQNLNCFRYHVRYFNLTLPLLEFSEVEISSRNDDLSLLKDKRIFCNYVY